MAVRQDASTGELVHVIETTDAAKSETLHVKVYSPYTVYFDEAAQSISAQNDTGPFDILPKHHNFLTLLRAGELSVVTERGPQKIRISRGVMHVKDNYVTVFLDV